MTCGAERLLVVGAMGGVGLGAFGVVVGAPTVVGAGVGAGLTVMSAAGVVGALMKLEQCLREHGKVSAARKIRRKIEKILEEFDGLRAKFPKLPKLLPGQ
jgi:hypothetical protein